MRSPLLKAKVPLPEASQPDKVETGPTIQSVLNSANGPSAKAGNINVSAENKASEGPLSITGINKLKSAITQQSIGEISIDQRQIVRKSKSLLPADDEISSEQSNLSLNNRSGFNKILILPLIFLALGFKIYFLTSLGSAAYASTPFILDQAGQIVIMILLLLLVLNVKN